MGVYQFGELAFLVSLIASVFLPMRFALIAYVVMCNIDMPGIGNIVKILIVPVILLFRLNRMNKHNHSNENPKIVQVPYLFWGIFLAYSIFAIAWSPINYTAGIKFSANLIGILLFYLVFKRANANDFLNARFLTASIVSTLALGIIQTYILDSTYGSEYSRFTGFMASQPYAAFLVGLLILVIWNNQYRIPTKLILSVSLITALILNGSRTWFIGACIVLAVLSLSTVLTSSLHISIVSFVLLIVIVGGSLFYNYAMQNQERLENSNRLFQGFYTLTGQDSNKGTIGFRKNMNEGMIDEIKHSTELKLFFGHGTSSSEYVARKYESYQFHGDNVDSNRVAHNEWLRITYEFGILGMMFWVSFLLSCFFYLVSKGYQVAPILAYGGGMLVALTSENVIMGAGTVGLCGLMIVIASKQKKSVSVDSTPAVTRTMMRQMNSRLSLNK
nr:O-antigen ligase family protein [Mycobacterium sp. E3298]